MNAHLFADAASEEEYPADGLPEVAVLGRSNVGKSSFINALLGRRKLARISRTPGKTRRVHFYRIDDAMYLVDLPGYGYAAVGSRGLSWTSRFKKLSAAVQRLINDLYLRLTSP